jgi:hypothetical protein
MRAFVGGKIPTEHLKNRAGVLASCCSLIILLSYVSQCCTDLNQNYNLSKKTTVAVSSVRWANPRALFGGVF